MSLGRECGFPSRTYSKIECSPFLQGIIPDDCSKWRSPVTQSLIFKDLAENFNDSERPTSQTFLRAVDRTMEIFSLREKVKMIHLNDVFKQELDIWTKSPGLPWSQMGYKTKGDIKRDPDAIQSVRRVAHFIKQGVDIHLPDCCAYVRSHTCDVGEFKVRAVWGYPATVTFMEAMFALPLIRAYKSLPASSRPIAYGFETLTGGMREIVKRFSCKGKKYVGIDFTKFDKTIPAWLIEIAFDILSLNIDFVRYEERGRADFVRNLHLYNALKRYFIYTPIRLANGQRFRKRSGIASGSYFTQLIGSVINSILIHWMFYEQQGRGPEDTIFMGDDSLIVTRFPFCLEKADQLMKTIGMKINTLKSQVENSLARVKFLGYYIGDGVPWKDRRDWVTALLYPERPDESWDDVQSRALGLYYANMGVDYYVHRICRILVKFKPFNLTLSRNFERGLKMIGLCIENLDPEKELPSATEFAIKLM